LRWRKRLPKRKIKRVGLDVLTAQGEVMASELIMGLGIFKTMFDMAKTLNNIHDVTSRDRVAMELQKEILAAQAQQTALIEKIGELEKQVAGFEKWDTEKEKYDLQEIYPKNYAYAIKESARGTAPAHLICATCYEDRKKPILQKSDAVHLICPICKTRVQFKESRRLPVTYGRGAF
jgi:hypothetical protein